MITEVLRRAFIDAPFTASEAAAVLGIKGPSSTLNRLKANGILERSRRGVYRFAPLDKWQRLDTFLEREIVRATRIERETTTAKMAAERWRAWKATGYVTSTGPRRFTVKLRNGGESGLRVRRK